MFERLPMYDVQEIRREVWQEGREKGRVEMLKRLYLDDVISADNARHRLAEFFSTEEISQFMGPGTKRA